MDDKELREQLAALEARNASLKEQQMLVDKIAALKAENEALDAQVSAEVAADEGEAAAGEPAGERAGDRRGSRTRNVLVGVLVVLSCLAVVVTGITIWTHYTVLDTKGYMNLVGPIGKDPQAIKALSDYVATQVVTATDLQQRTATALPPKAQFLAGPITGAVNDFVASGTDKVLSTPQAYDLWLRINEVAHTKIVALLRGDTTYAYIQGSDVRLNTLPLVSQALVWVDGKLPGGLAGKFSPPMIAPGTDPATAIQQVSAWSGRPLPADFGQITLLKSNSLGPAQKAVRWFDTLVWVIPIMTFVLIAVTVWLSRRRRRTLIELGVGVAVALILTRVIVKQAASAIADGLHQTGGLNVARDVVHASLGPLTTITIWIVVIGVVVAVSAWFSGRRDLQAAVVATGKRVVSKRHASAALESPAVEWMERHLQLLRWAGLIVGLLLLVLFTWSWLGIGLIVVLTLLHEGVLSLVGGQWPFAGERTRSAAAPE
jgi:hypothetical protein